MLKLIHTLYKKFSLYIIYLIFQFTRMLAIPLFFYEVYSQSFLNRLHEINCYVCQIEETLPDHFIVKQFHDLYFKMTQTMFAMIDEETIEEYFEKIIEFYQLLQLFKRLEDEIIVLQTNRRVHSRVRNYYCHLFLKKKNCIFSFPFQKKMDLTLNSLMMKEMEQEIYNIQRINYPSRKFENKLPIVLEHQETLVL